MVFSKLPQGLDPQMDACLSLKPTDTNDTIREIEHVLCRFEIKCLASFILFTLEELDWLNLFNVKKNKENLFSSFTLYPLEKPLPSNLIQSYLFNNGWLVPWIPADIPVKVIFDSWLRTQWLKPGWQTTHQAYSKPTAKWCGLSLHVKKCDLVRHETLENL